MQVPVRWLKEFVETDLSTEEIAHRLTMAGLEAEGITRIGEEWERVFVGEVVDVSPHPDADRLVLAHVIAGEHDLTVVTGAPNIEAGQRVPLALAGAELIDAYSEEPRRRKLKPSKIRGVRSEGMVCSEKELGLSDEHEGILVLEPDAPLGAPLREYLGDDVIEFEITPNLVHAFSILGIARELAALLGKPARQLEVADLSTVPRADERVEIAAPEHCGRFTYTLIENATVEPSPTWLQRRLIAAGLRPINNYVDISNYVMLEMGHPTHPFDADKLASERIIVRLARPGEKITTIDHVERELDEQILVIADEERPVGIAGVMGGVETEITEPTQSILLESAWFQPKTIRYATRTLKLNSDASARFGRDIDPNGASIAAARIVELVKQVDPNARVVRFADQFIAPRERRTVELPYGEIERLLGMTIPIERVIDIFERLDLQPEVVGSTDSQVIVTHPPTYRNDINLPADLVEEAIRIHGYDQLPETIISGTAVQVSRDPARLVDQIVQNALVEAGLQQVQTYTMINDDDLRRLSISGDQIPDVLGGYPRPESDYIRATNPLRSDWTLMRPTMIPSLLRIVAENLKFSDRVAIFETARTYQPEPESELPDERRAVALALSGRRASFDIHHPESDELDFFDARGAIETVIERIGEHDVAFARVEHPSMHPGRTAAIQLDGVQVGVVGEIHPLVGEHFGIERRTAVAELDLVSFAATIQENWRVQQVGRHQPIRQDFAVVVDESVEAAAVRDAILKGAGFLASEAILFDIFRGESIGTGNKSLAFRVTFAAPDRQPAEHEIERARDRIAKSVAEQVGGSLRT